MSAPPTPSPAAPSDEVVAIRRRGLSVGVATGLYGVSFGALATASGLGVGQAVVLSALLFSGGSQFALVGVIGGGGGAVGAVLASALLGLRNTLYGAVLAPSLPRGGLRGLVRSLLTIDESTATALTGSTPAARRAGFWATGVWAWVFWNLSSIAGALAGQHVADPGAWGLDGASAAAFCALLWPRLVRRDLVALAVAAGFVAALTTPVLPSGLPILAAAALAIVAGLVGRAREGGRA